ncbi:MAG: lysophospholipid acyltransferase family protein [Armatimonadetes bacterium]|nr:lysophospholipid acyltransferase family protein [Armatimonadota bacterium]
MVGLERAPGPARTRKSALRRRVEQSCIYWLTAFAAWGLARLPLRWLRAMGNAIGWGIFATFRSRQRLADANLVACFGDRFTARERRHIRLFCTSNAAKTMLELLKRPRMPQGEIMAEVRMVGQEHMERAHAAGRGVIACTPHYGNWELAGALLSLLWGNMAVVARDANDPRTAEIINRAREASGQRVLARTDTMQMMRTLRAGGILGILPDQHQALGGETLTFLGRPAKTALGPAMLSLRTGAPIVVLFARRLPDDTFEVRFCEPLWPPADEDRSARAAAALMQRVNDLMSEEIAAHPEQWLWLHNRWKET